MLGGGMGVRVGGGMGGEAVFDSCRFLFKGVVRELFGRVCSGNPTPKSGLPHAQASTLYIACPYP